MLDLSSYKEKMDSVKRKTLFDNFNPELLKNNQCGYCGHRLYYTLDGKKRYCKSILCYKRQGKRFFQRLDKNNG